jgi:hypothetical protein
LKLESDGSLDFEKVRKARLVEKNYGHLTPLIEPSREDPDCYTFVWPGDSCYVQRFGEFVQSRFFRLKDVYGAIVQAQECNLAVDCGDVFVGAYGSDVAAEQVTEFENMDTHFATLHKPMELRVHEEPFSVCVAVCKEANNALRVVHVEGRSGKLDKAWVKGVSLQLGAKAQTMLSWETLKEDVKRIMLLKLRGALEKRALTIPNRYVKLFEELLDYSHKNPSSGYVYALAFAVDLASH